MRVSEVSLGYWAICACTAATALTFGSTAAAFEALTELAAALEALAALARLALAALALEADAALDELALAATLEDLLIDSDKLLACLETDWAFSNAQNVLFSSASWR